MSSFLHRPGTRPSDQLKAAIGRLESSTGDVNHRIALAEAAFRLAVQPDTDIEEAIELLTKAETHDPYHPKIPFHLGRLRHQNGDPRGAVFEYRRALRLAPGSHRTHVHLALALELLTPEERTLALNIFMALAEGDDRKLRALTEELDQVIEGQATRARKSSPAKKGEPSPAHDAAATAGRCRWKGLWKLSLLRELAKVKARGKRIIGQNWEEGKARIDADRGASEYALACLFLLLESPAACRDVEDKLREARLADRDRMAVRLLLSACELGKAESAEAFVDLATASMQSAELPAELVCCLHYSWYGTASKLDAVKAAALVDRYPEEIRTLPCFREMRVAILDRHAHEAWADDRLDRAEILWQETIALDPFRIAVAHNLALVATRVKSPEKYERAWERARELRYLLAAAAGEARVELDDRARLHRSFAEQCQLRYSGTPGSRGGERPREELAAWMADHEALTTWLREWELYYLNSRIRFHSIVHLLGVSRDCSDEDADAARDGLLLQFDVCGNARRWAGMQVFLDLVKELAANACEQARDSIARKRDPYFEVERADADKLATEAIERGVQLLRMLKMAVESGSGDLSVAGYHVARSLLLMPWRSLEPACRSYGVISGDDHVVDICLSHFLALVIKDLKNEGVPGSLEAKLDVFRDGLRALPDSVELRLWHCRFLLQAKRYRQSYDAALDALPRTEKMPDRKAAHDLQQQLVICIDNAALAQFRPELLRRRSRDVLPKTIAEGYRILADLPRAGGLRQLIAECLIQLADEDPARLAEAAALLEAGLELVLSDEQLQGFRRLLERAGSRSRSVEAVARIRSLFESASTRAREAVEIVREDRTPASLRQAREWMAEAIHETEQAEAVANDAELPAWAGKARQLSADLGQILQGFEQG